MRDTFDTFRKTILIFFFSLPLLLMEAILPDVALAEKDGHPVVVSFGDSYSSGEGAGSFEGYDLLESGDYNSLCDPNKSGFLAHRSLIAWPGALEINGVPIKNLRDKGGWYFLAISGAETNTILEEGSTLGKEFKRGDFKRTVDLEAEIKTFNSLVGKEFDANDIDYVTLTLGGNDVGFVNAVITSAVNGLADPYIAKSHPISNIISYIMYYTGANTIVSSGILQAMLSSSVNKFNETTLKDLEDTYNKIDEACGNNEHVLVAGYPHLFPENGSQLDLNISDNPNIDPAIHHIIPARWAGISAADAKMINHSVDLFDEGIKQLIESIGKGNIHYAEVRDVFLSNRYGTKNCINPIYLFPKYDDLSLICGYSVHPNPNGQRAYAEAVQRVIDKIEKEKTNQNVSADSTSVVPSSVPSASGSFNSKPSAKSSNVNISIVMDVSGSMGDSSAYGSQTKLQSARQQSIGFVKGSIHNEGNLSTGLSTKVGVCTFDTTAQTVCGLADNATSVIDALNSLQPSGRTNMYGGLEAGIRQLEGEDATKIMVFLSDGLTNEGPSESSILDLAREAADKNITIYTIGYGPSGDLDENLLKEMASITGGMYSHEDPSNAVSASVGLFATMMDAQLRETQEILLSQTGTVGQGSTVEAGNFTVNTTGTLSCYLYWPGSVLDIQLIDPDGNEIKDGYSGYKIDNSSIPTKVTIENAKQGTWKMSVYGREVSMNEEPFYAATAIEQRQATTANMPSGGSSNDSSAVLLLLVSLLCIGGVFGVYALSMRRR